MRMQALTLLNIINKKTAIQNLFKKGSDVP